MHQTQRLRWPRTRGRSSFSWLGRQTSPCGLGYRVRGGSASDLSDLATPRREDIFVGRLSSSGISHAMNVASLPPPSPPLRDGPNDLPLRNREHRQDRRAQNDVTRHYDVPADAGALLS